MRYKVEHWVYNDRWFISQLEDGLGRGMIRVEDQKTAETAARILNGEEVEMEKGFVLVGPKDGLLKQCTLTEDQYNRIMAIADEKPEPAPTLQKRMGAPWRVDEAGAIIDSEGYLCIGENREKVVDIVNTVVGKLLDEKGKPIIGRIIDELEALGRRLMEEGHG